MSPLKSRKAEEKNEKNYKKPKLNKVCSIENADLSARYANIKVKTKSSQLLKGCGGLSTQNTENNHLRVLTVHYNVA